MTILLIISIIKSWRLVNATAQDQLPEKTSSYESYSWQSQLFSLFFFSSHYFFKTHFPAYVFVTGPRDWSAYVRYHESFCSKINPKKLRKCFGLGHGPFYRKLNPSILVELNPSIKSVYWPIKSERCQLLHSKSATYGLEKRNHLDTLTRNHIQGTDISSKIFSKATTQFYQKF